MFRKQVSTHVLLPYASGNASRPLAPSRFVRTKLVSLAGWVSGSLACAREVRRLRSQLESRTRLASNPDTTGPAYRRAPDADTLEGIQRELDDAFGRLAAFSEVDARVARAIVFVHAPTAIAHALDEVDAVIDAHADSSGDAPPRHPCPHLRLAFDAYEAAGGRKSNPRCASGRA